jgi:hypothetical protein
MNVKLWCCLTLLLSVFFVTNPAWAKEVTVQGSGATRDDAIRDALRQAVEQAVGVLVDSQTLTRNFAVVNDEIYTKSQGFVQDYHVISEQAGSVYTVNVNVTVDTDPDSALYTRLQKLRLIEVMLRDPRIAVIIPESFRGEALPESVSETAVIQKLRDAGFKHVLDAAQVSANQRTQLLKAILDGDYQAAKAAATSAQLDLVIVGSGTSQYVGNLYDSGVRSSRAHIDARVLKVDTGEIIAAKGYDASGVDITPLAAAQKALTATGEQLGDYMVQQLMQYASDPDKPLTITVRCSGFQKLNLLQNGLKSVSGVKSVFLRSYSGGIAQIDVTYTGAPKALADAMQNIEGISVDISGITNSSLEVVLQ